MRAVLSLKNLKTDSEGLFRRVVLRIHGSVARPLFRQVFQGKDSGDRTDGHACATINTFRGIDKKLVDLFVVRLVLTGVDAINGAHVDARSVFGADARLGDY